MVRGMLLLLLACATDPEGAAVASSEPPAPPAPVYSGEEALAAMARGVELGIPSPRHVEEQYLELLSHGDEQCPGLGNQLIYGAFPDTGCTAQSGYFYSGVSIYLAGSDLTGTTDPNVDAMLLGGDFQIEDPSGGVFFFGGQVDWRLETIAEGQAVQANVKGTLGYEGGDPWFADGTSSMLQLRVNPVATGFMLSIYGGVSGAQEDVWMERLDFSPEACPGGEPSGAITVRDEAGGWWRLDYGTACTSCGVLSYPGIAQADACLDLTGLREPTLAMLGLDP